MDMIADLAPFNPNRSSEDINERLDKLREESGKYQSPSQYYRSQIKDNKEKKDNQLAFWKAALVVLLLALLIYVFYRLYKDSTSKIDSLADVNASGANALLKRGINLQNFVDMH